MTHFRDRAEAAAQRGDISAAIELLQAHIAERADDDPCWLRLAELLTQASRFDEAEQAIARAVHAEQWERDCRMAHVCLESGRYEQAAALFMRTHAALPRTSVLVLAAACLNRIDRFEEALELARQATDCEPDNDEAWYHRAVAEEGLRLPYADECYERVLELDPSNFKARQQLGMLRYLFSRHDEAEALMQACMADRPYEVWPPYVLGLIAERRGNMEGAVTYLSRALDNDPENGLVATELAAMLAREGRADEARAALDRAVTRSRLTRKNLLTCARAYEQIGDDDAALDCDRRAREIEGPS